MARSPTASNNLTTNKRGEGKLSEDIQKNFKVPDHNQRAYSSRRRCRRAVGLPRD